MSGRKPPLSRVHVSVPLVCRSSSLHCSRALKGMIAPTRAIELRSSKTFPRKFRFRKSINKACHNTTITCLQVLYSPFVLLTQDQVTQSILSLSFRRLSSIVCAFRSWRMFKASLRSHCPLPRLLLLLRVFCIFSRTTWRIQHSTISSLKVVMVNSSLVLESF